MIFMGSEATEQSPLCPLLSPFANLVVSADAFAICPKN
jgi:hypothetical protein